MLLLFCKFTELDLVVLSAFWYGVFRVFSILKLYHYIEQFISIMENVSCTLEKMYSKSTNLFQINLISNNSIIQDAV